MRRLITTTLGCLLLVSAAKGQGHGEPVAAGLARPIGIELDAQGRLWVAEQGTGAHDGRISVVTADGTVHPFITGLRSVIVEGSPESAQHLRFHDGALWATYGLGADVPESYLLRMDTTGWHPGDAPHPAAHVDSIDVGSFVLAQHEVYTHQTSAYNLAFGPGGDAFIADASANALLRRDAETGALSLVAVFAPLPNPTPVGPPTVEPVPTALAWHGPHLYVSLLTGFPFADGLAAVYTLDEHGHHTVYQDGLTLLTDLALDPRDEKPVALQIARFDLTSPTGFLPGTGAVLKLQGGGRVDTMAAGLTAPAGLAFAPNGDLYVSSNFTGEVLRIDAAHTAHTVVAVDAPGDVPRSIALSQNYPNPFNPATRLRYELSAPAHVVLRIFDVLGREVDTLVDAVQPAGVHEVAWDSRTAGPALGSGVYLYRLEAGGQVQARTMLLAK